jgi:hypothetical protein
MSQPRKFAPLIELDLFVDVHSVPPGPEPGLDAPRQRICRMCAVEVLLYGLKDWWIRERKKGLLDATVSERPDCLDGPACRRQKEHGKLPSGPHSAQKAHDYRRDAFRIQYTQESVRPFFYFYAPFFLMLGGGKYPQSTTYSTPRVKRRRTYRFRPLPPRRPRAMMPPTRPFPMRLVLCTRNPASTRKRWSTRP